MPQWFESQAALDAAVQDLKNLGSAARKLLEEVVEHTTVTRTRPSPAAEALCDAGFLHIRELTVWDKSVEYMASLWGEEALEALEAFEAAGVATAAKRRKGTRPAQPA